MGKIIAICNQKGGTGKTTSAINLAAYIALNNKKILLIDLDLQANATSGLGIDKTKIGKGTYEVLLQQVRIEECMLSTGINNLFLLPANPKLVNAEIELVNVSGREQRLRNSLESVRDNLDFMLVDCPPSLGLLTVNALCAADSVFIPVQCEYYALEGLSQLLSTIARIKTDLNPHLEIEGLVLTMADYRTNLTREVIAETRAYFSSPGTSIWSGKAKVYDTVIPRNIRLSEAPSFGKPIVLYDKNSLGAQKYWELSCELLGLPLNSIQTEALQHTEESIVK